MLIFCSFISFTVRTLNQPEVVLVQTKGCLRWRPNLNSLLFYINLLLFYINLLLEKQNWMTHFLHLSVDHFTVVYLAAWPSNERETGVDLILIKTSLHFV